MVTPGGASFVPAAVGRPRMRAHRGRFRGRGPLPLCPDRPLDPPPPHCRVHASPGRGGGLRRAPRAGRRLDEARVRAL